MAVTASDQIEFFFTEPTVNLQGGQKSVLYLLRQEIQDCLIGMVIPEDQVVQKTREVKHRVFATMLVLFAGKIFYRSSTRETTRAATWRADRGVHEALRVQRADRQLYADVFYFGCRNPMVHSFNLHNAKFEMTVLSTRI